MRRLPLRVRVTLLVVLTAAVALLLIVLLGGISTVEESIAETTLESSSGALDDADANLRRHGDLLKIRIGEWAATSDEEHFDDWDGLPGLNVAVLDQDGRTTDLRVEGPVSIGSTYQCQSTAGNVNCLASSDGDTLSASPQLGREVEARAEAISDGVPAVVHGFAVEDELGRSFVVRLDTDVFAATEVEITSGIEDLSIIVLPLMLVALGVITWISLGQALSPVAAIITQVDRIGGESLDQRVPVPSSDDELQRLAETMNRMLDRLQRASESQRQFISDASHELRSPITATGATLEVARANPEQTDWAQVAGVVEEENARLADLVDDLLLLARLDEEQRPSFTAGDVVDLEEICLGEAERPHPVDVTVRVVAPARVTGNLATLTRAIRNLVDNAAAYAESQVQVEVDTSGDWCTVSVRDDGPGVPPKFRDQIFERFVRADRSRTRDGLGGAGLGLAIARRIALTHGGTLELVDSDEPGATFLLRLPGLVPAEES